MPLFDVARPGLLLLLLDAAHSELFLFARSLLRLDFILPSCSAVRPGLFLPVVDFACAGILLPVQSLSWSDVSLLLLMNLHTGFFPLVKRFTRLGFVLFAFGICYFGLHASSFGLCSPGSITSGKVFQLI